MATRADSGIVASEEGVADGDGAGTAVGSVGKGDGWLDATDDEPGAFLGSPVVGSVRAAGASVLAAGAGVGVLATAFSL